MQIKSVSRKGNWNLKCPISLVEYLDLNTFLKASVQMDPTSQVNCYCNVNESYDNCILGFFEETPEQESTNEATASTTESSWSLFSTLINVDWQHFGFEDHDVPEEEVQLYHLQLPSIYGMSLDSFLCQVPRSWSWECRSFFKLSLLENRWSKLRNMDVRKMMKTQGSTMELTEKKRRAVRSAASFASGAKAPM